ncbi:MAG: hypothetical protein KGI29_04660 [Pseudomonadota bacterium]|nr:hypothetical protein [Pseudomonadota bacterium]MDE3037088.1 hypothetical protein [Pseudomonadota bacterium]
MCKAQYIPETAFLVLLLAFLAWVGCGEYFWNQEVAYFCPNSSSIFSMTLE